MSTSARTPVYGGPRRRALSAAAVSVIAAGLSLGMLATGSAARAADTAAPAPGLILHLPQGVGAVADQATGAVTPLELRAATPAASITVGPQLFAVAIAPDGKTALAARYGSTSVVPVTIATHKVGAPIPVGKDPSDIAISPDGTTAYVTNRGSATVTVISLVTDSRTRTLHLLPHAQPEAIAITRDGDTAYVADEGIGRVTPIDLVDDTVEHSIRVGDEPSAIAINNGASAAYVTNFGSNTVSVLNLRRRRVQTTYLVDGEPDGVAILPAEGLYVACFSGDDTDFVPFRKPSDLQHLATGDQPTAVAYVRKSDTAYVADYDGGHGSLVSIDPSTQTFETPHHLGKGPIALSTDPDSPLLLVANYDGGEITVVKTAAVESSPAAVTGHSTDAVAITPSATRAWACSPRAHEIVPVDLATERVGTPIVVGGTPDAIAITTGQGGLTAWVADKSGDRVDQVDLGSHAVVRRIKVGRDPVALTLSPDNRTLFVVNEGSDDVTPIDVATATRSPAFRAGRKPIGMAFTQGGSIAAVTDAGRGVTVLNAATERGRVFIRLPGVSGASYGKLSSSLYAVSAKTGMLYRIQVGARKAVPVGEAGSDPVACAVEPNSSVALVLDHATARLLEIDLANGKTISNVATGAGPVAIAIHTFGK